MPTTGRRSGQPSGIRRPARLHDLSRRCGFRRLARSCWIRRRLRQPELEPPTAFWITRPRRSKLKVSRAQVTALEQALARRSPQAMRAIDSRLSRLEQRFGIARTTPRFLLIFDGWRRRMGPADDTYTKILDEAGFLHTAGFGMVDFGCRSWRGIEGANRSKNGL